MLTWLKNLLFDETAFVGVIRATGMGVGGAVATGQFPVADLPEWLGIVCLAAAGFVRSSSRKG